MNTGILERLLTDQEAAPYVGYKVQTLRNLRFLGRGPRYLKLGKAVRYRPSDLRDWVDAHVIEPEKECEAPPHKK